MNIIRKKEEPKFLDIKARLFQNKSNGQLSISLPKKQLRKFIDLNNQNPELPERKMPKKIPIRIFTWGNR